MFMGLLCMNQGGISILYSQIWECKVLEHLGHSLKIPGWLSDLYAPCGPRPGLRDIGVTSEKSRGEVCSLEAAGHMGEATPKPGYKDKEPRGLPPILLRTCCLTLRK